MASPENPKPNPAAETLKKLEDAARQYTKVFPRDWKQFTLPEQQEAVGGLMSGGITSLGFSMLEKGWLDERNHHVVESLIALEEDVIRKYTADIFPRSWKQFTIPEQQKAIQFLLRGKLTPFGFSTLKMGWLDREEPSDDTLQWRYPAEPPWNEDSE